MKFLLTSAGITNESIAKALFDLVGKMPKETNVAFVPTAANIQPGDKGWVIDDMSNIRKRGVASLDIVDIAALGQDVWRSRLENADVLAFGGGDTFYLMRWMRESGLADALGELLATGVFMGISAGSIMTGRRLSRRDHEMLYLDEDPPPDASEEGLGFFDFHFRPHLNSPEFPEATTDVLEKLAKDLEGRVYALDDQSALKIEDGNIKVVSEGEWLQL